MDRASLLVFLLCSCTLTQALPLSNTPDILLSSTHSEDVRLKRNSDNICTLDGQKALPLGQTANRLVDTTPEQIKSVDICFVVASSNTMPVSNRWIQYISDNLDEIFQSVGVGNETSSPNRFCVVVFGAKNEKIRAKMVKIDNQVFFSAGEVTETRSSLKRNGYVADGYEAIEYTLRNIPFRDNPHVARGVILVTDIGRGVLADRVNLTKSVMSRLLDQSNITLDVITNIDIEANDHILGITDYFTEAILNNNIVSYSEKGVNITGSHGNILTHYAELAFHTGGGAWLLNPLYSDVKDPVYKPHINGIARGYVDTRSYLKSKGCEVCSCVEGDNGGAVLECSRPNNQRGCILCTDTEDNKCLGYNLTEDYPLQIYSKVSRQQSTNQINVSFHGNRGDVSFDCILLTNHTRIEQCASPVVFENLSVGYHKLLLVGRTVDGMSMDLKTIDFEIPTNNTSKISLVIISQTSSTTESEVTFQATSPYSNSHVTVMCKVDNGQYFICTSPLSIKRLSGKWHRTLSIIATDDHMNIEMHQEAIYFQGENKFTLSKHGVDAHGSLGISLHTSNDPIQCVCSFYDAYYTYGFDCTPTDKSYQMSANSTELGDGSHTLYAICVYSPNFHEYQTLDFKLQSKAATNVQCSLNIRGPFPNQTAVADFTCNTPSVATSCSIDNLPSQNCSTGYSFSTSALSPGYHTFTLEAIDAISSSSAIYQTLYPFFVESDSNAKCCPVISSNQLNVVSNNGNNVTVSIDTDIGNCTSRDEFSYNLSWGDGTVYSGVTAGHLTPLVFSRTYSTQGEYTATIDYCTNAANDKLKCCSTLLVPIAAR